MHSFKDNTGKVWNLSLNLHTARVIEAANFEAVYDKPIKLLGPTVEIELLLDALTNLGVVFTMARCMLYKELEEEGLDEEAFAKRIEGPEKRGMQHAVWDEFVNFFPEHRTSLSNLVEGYKKMQKTLEQNFTGASVDKMTKKMNSLIDGIAAKLDQELEKISMEQVGPGQTSS